MKSKDCTSRTCATGWKKKGKIRINKKEMERLSQTAEGT